MKAHSRPNAQFTTDTRALLLDCCHFQRAAISPAIFGAMFQKVIELDARERRRQLGAHYTSEANIRKVIGPLFLDELRAAIETAAQAVLDARAAFPDATLAQLYDPLTMPAALVKAHQALDRAVDGAYRPDGGARSYVSDAERVAFLFTRYAALSAPLA